MSDTVIEWAPFRLRPGVGEDALLALSDGLEKGFLKGRKGYLRRELARGEKDGEYIDIVWWESMEAAEAAMQHVAGSPACSAYFAAMAAEDGAAGAGVRHFRVARAY